jgi:hypothetical protein
MLRLIACYAYSITKVAEKISRMTLFNSNITRALSLTGRVVFFLLPGPTSGLSLVRGLSRRFFLARRCT